MNVRLIIFLVALAIGSGVLASPLGRTVIRHTVHKRREVLHNCYRKGLEKNPKLRGKVVVAFTILSRGFVKNANIVNTTLNDASVEACIVKQVNSMRFPQSGKDITIYYPFRFQPLDKSASYHE